MRRPGDGMVSDADVTFVMALIRNNSGKGRKFDSQFRHRLLSALENSLSNYEEVRLEFDFVAKKDLERVRATTSKLRSQLNIDGVEPLLIKVLTGSISRPEHGVRHDAEVWSRFFGARSDAQSRLSTIAQGLSDIENSIEQALK